MATIIRDKPEVGLEDIEWPVPELIDCQVELVGQLSDAIAANLLIIMGGFATERKLGLVNGAQGSYQIFADDPKKFRVPDVSFTHRERLPETGPAEGHGRIAPDLTVEVISPNDLAMDVSIKVMEFLGAGVRLVWVVTPFLRDVQVYRAGGRRSLLEASDTLDGEDVLPGFHCLVEELFKV
jgi:Uma2 family endonuclease